MKKQKTDTAAVWGSQWEKRPFVWTRTHTYFVVFAVIGVLCVAFVWWRLFTTGSGSAADVRVDFNNYVFELMEEYKPSFVLCDRLADPKALLREDGWQVTGMSTDRPDEPVKQLLGEGCVIQSWEDLKQAEADQLWQTWFYGDKEMRSDVFVITELSLHIDNKTLPALQENTWLVTDTSGTKYILICADGVWGVKLLAAFR